MDFENEFLPEMAKVAVATQSEYAEGEINVYWEKFQYWPYEDFRAAMESCSDECKRFPTVWDIKDRRPKKFATIEDVEKRIYKRGDSIDALPAFSQTETADDRGPDTIETKIDSLSDSDVEQLFGRLFISSRVCLTPEHMKKASKFSADMFRRNPNGRLYRGVLRDLVAQE